MDEATANFYSENASSVSERYESIQSSVARYFALAFPQGSRVLDVGAGSGRDLAAMLALGYDGYGVEPVGALIEEALRFHPELGGRLRAGALPTLGLPFAGAFDGILCSAVLMHVPEGDLFDAAFALRQVLRPHGRLLLSLPLTRGDVNAEERDANGRLFKAYSSEYVQLLFERIGFQQIGRWDSDDALDRSDVRWCTQLFELRLGGTVRAVDQIEGILNRDRKVTTYKLALFRALAELGTQEPHCARWLPAGTVGLPLRRVAEKWLGYYWPIFAASRYVPQSQTEGAGESRPVKFRLALTTLMAPYASSAEHGGLSAWQLDLSLGRLSDPSARNLELALKDISMAIRDGPVLFSGGALESGTVFGYDQSTGHIRMSADLWREFSLLGHWIADAVVLR